MKRRIKRLTTIMVTVMALTCGMILSFVVTADADPTVPAGFWVERFADVTSPFHLAFDGDGNLFVGNAGSGPVRKVSPDGQTVENFGPSLSDPDGVIVDLHGDFSAPGSVLVGNGHYIHQISPDGSDDGILSYYDEYDDPDRYTNAQQLAFDSTGRLIFVDVRGKFNGRLLALDKNLDLTITWSSLPLGGVAVGDNDRIFVSRYNSDSKIGDVQYLANGVLVPLAGGLSYPDALAFDRYGRFGGALYVVERNSGKITRIDPTTGNTEFFAENIDGPFGLAFGPDGDLFVSESGTGTIWRIGHGLKAGVDIKPGSCRNPVNVKSNGVLPVAILGSSDFDVNEIDPSSVRLNGVAAIRSNIEDVTQPDDCYDLGPDGFEDLTLKFTNQEIIESLGDVNDGEEIVLQLTGNLKEEFEGSAIRGKDTMIILKKGKK